MIFGTSVNIYDCLIRSVNMTISQLVILLDHTMSWQLINTVPTFHASFNIAPKDLARSPFKVLLPKVTSGREKGPSTVDPKIHYVIAPSSLFSVAPRAHSCCPSPRPRQSVHLRSVSGGNRVDLGLRDLTSRGGAESGRPT